MTTRLCFAACQRSPFESSEQTALQTRRPNRGHPPGLLSLRPLKFVTIVAAGDNKQASDSVGAGVDGFSLARPTRSSSAQRSAGLVGHVEDGADKGLLRESDETQRPVRLQDLRIGSICKGKVSVVESYGVFVDIGVHTDGFVHISRLGRSFVRRVEDVVKVGQDVCVQVVDLDLHTNSISLLLRPDEGFDESVGLRPLTLPEHEIANRAAARRANKLARRAENPLPRRVMSLETRRQLKAYRRAVLAERQAIQLHQARLRATISNDINVLDEVSEAKC